MIYWRLSCILKWEFRQIRNRKYKYQTVYTFQLGIKFIHDISECTTIKINVNCI